MQFHQPPLDPVNDSVFIGHRVIELVEWKTTTLLC